MIYGRPEPKTSISLDTTALPTGSIIDSRFEVVRRLGQGTSGTVYHVKDRELNGSDFALKLIHPQLLTNAQGRERVQSEMLVNRQLNHRNIVRVYECALTESGNSYLLAELVVGCTLEELLTACRRLCPEDAAAILWGIAAGLQAAHSAGVVHRDLKPQNILLSRTGEIKLVDFGLARIPGDVLQTSQLVTDAGTPAYMAPEQFRGQSVDARADLYSLGAIAYELVAGFPPVTDTNLFRVAEAHIRGRWIPLDRVRPGLPQWYLDLVDRLLQPDFERRAQNLIEVRNSLAEHVPEDLQPQARLLVSKQSQSQRRRTVASRVRMVMVSWLLASVVIAAAALAVRTNHSLYFRFGQLMLIAEQALGADLPLWRTAIDFSLSCNDPHSIFDVLHQITKTKSNRRLLDQTLSWSRASNRLDSLYVGPLKDYEGMSALHLFTNLPLQRQVDSALKRGASTQVQDRSGNTPLHLAATSGGTDLLRTISRYQQQPLLLNRDGFSPLHLIILNKYPNRVAQLLEGLPPSVRHHAVQQADATGRTPLDLAAELPPKVRDEMREVLLRYRNAAESSDRSDVPEKGRQSLGLR